MRMLALLLLVGCGDKETPDDSAPDLTWRPCRTWCEDRAEQYGRLTAGSPGAQDGSLPGWSGGTYDIDTAIAACAEAPEDDRCETCTGWYFDTHLQPASLSAACDAVYRPGPAQADGLTEDELAARTAECQAQCADYALAY